MPKVKMTRFKLYSKMFEWAKGFGFLNNDDAPIEKLSYEVTSRISKSDKIPVIVVMLYSEIVKDERIHYLGEFYFDYSENLTKATNYLNALINLLELNNIKTSDEEVDN